MEQQLFAPIDVAWAKSQTQEEKTLLILQKLLQESRKGVLSIFIEKVPEDLKKLSQKDASPIVLQDHQLYLQRNFSLKQKIDSNIRRLLTSNSQHRTTLTTDLQAEQKKAFEQVFQTSVTLITGGPGSGKSFLAKKILDAFQTLYPEQSLLYTAPTGKAVSHFSTENNTQLEKKTLHALLGIREHRRPKETRPIIAKAVILDEISMVDPELFSLCVQAIGSKTTLVLLGDPFQLPPVDKGGVLDLLIQEKKVPHIALQTTHRYETKSLHLFAEGIKNSETEKVFSLAEDPSVEEIQLHPLTTSFPDIFQKEDLQILTPFTQGPFGRDALNNYYEERNPHSQTPIIVTKNDYKLGLMNGDIGHLENGMVYFSHKEDGIFASLLLSYEKAFALSVHKSQGSEWKHIALFLPPGSEQFGKKLLYTAVTRAKNSISIYAEKETLQRCLET